MARVATGSLWLLGYQAFRSRGKRMRRLGSVGKRQGRRQWSRVVSCSGDRKSIWKSGSSNEGPLLVFVGATEGRSRSWTRRCRSCATPSTSRSTCRRSCSTTAATRTTRPAAAPTACRPWTTPGPLTSRTSVPWRVVVFYCPFTYACESNYFSFHGSQGPKGLTVKVEVRTRNETTKLVFPSTSPAGGTQTRPSYGLDSSTVAHLAAKPHNSFECLATSFSRTANFQQKNTRVAY